jgi:hypothetical protein
LPEAFRFSQLEELDWAFGTMGTQESQAFGDLVPRRYLRFYVECVDANFGFSRYAERLGEVLILLTNCMGVATRTNLYRSLLSILKENRNDKTYFLISVPFREFYTVLLDQHNGLKPSS